MASRPRRHWFAILLAVVVLGAGSLWLAFRISPWPNVLLIRMAFDSGAKATVEALEKHVPANVVSKQDLAYGEGADESFDLFRPSAAGADQPLPTIVWVHGGAFISGDKADVAPYLKILAGSGYATVGINYSIAPGARYPTPLVQLDKALAHLKANAATLGIDAGRIVLAGDSAGSQIAAQMSLAVSDPAYAARIGLKPALEREFLKGVVLFCGVYDPSAINMDGAFGSFIRTAMWSYFGTRDMQGDQRLDDFTVNRHLSASYPPTFIAVGNADPLAPQTRLLDKALRDAGVAVDSLTFPDDYQPALPHEFQFNLDTDAGKQALSRLLAFLESRK